LLKNHGELAEYFCGKLDQAGADPLKGIEKDKQDLVIFSIMLLVSRFVPFSFSMETSPVAQEKYGGKLKDLVKLIGAHSGNGTYFVRKISAQALLPLTSF
jgi:hypothetical protein